MTQQATLINKFVNYVNNHIDHNDYTINLNNLRIMTFNVHMWTSYNNKSNIKEVKDLISKSNPDIIGLCESLYRGQTTQNFYDQHFAYGVYKYYACCNERYGINIILSKFPIIFSHDVSLGKDPIKHINRHALFVTINVNDNNLNIILTHLDVYDETEKTRLNQMNLIMKTIQKFKFDNCIIMGDFNSLRKSDYSLNEWNEIVNLDSLRNVQTKTLLIDYIESNNYVTHLNSNLSVWSMRRVDYIYVSKDYPFDVTTTFTMPTLISDHFPIVIDIDLNKN